MTATPPNPATWLSRRNPTVKISLLLAVSLSVMFVLDPATAAALYLLALIGVASTSGLSLRRLATAQLPFVGFALGVFVVNLLSRPGDVLWQAGLLRITVEGASVGAALALRTLLIGVLSIGFLASTDAVSLMTSLHQHARLPARVAYAIMAGQRMLQQLPSEWQLIRQAQSVRAPLGRHGRPRSSLAGFGRAAFALLVSAIRRSERVAQSLESRGLGLSPRTVWRPVPLRRSDAVFAAATLLIVGGVLASSAAVGTLAGPGALF